MIHGLDVFAEEPYVPDELRMLDNVVLLPHIGGLTARSFYRTCVSTSHTERSAHRSCTQTGTYATLFTERHDG